MHCFPPPPTPTQNHACFILWWVCSLKPIGQCVQIAYEKQSVQTSGSLYGTLQAWEELCAVLDLTHDKCQSSRYTCYAKQQPRQSPSSTHRHQEGSKDSREHLPTDL